MLKECLKKQCAEGCDQIQLAENKRPLINNFVHGNQKPEYLLNKCGAVRFIVFLFFSSSKIWYSVIGTFLSITGRKNISLLRVTAIHL